MYTVHIEHTQYFFIKILSPWLSHVHGKNSFGGHPLREDKLWWKTIKTERPSLMEDNLKRKAIFDGKTFDGRQPSIEDI